jgi:hypothetical protein
MSTKDELLQERLLKEYEIGIQYAIYHAQITWQTASIFLSVSLAGLAYFSASRPENWISVIGRSVIYIGVVMMIEGWFYLFRRWNGYLAVGFGRMEEIENVLGGMFLVRYGQHLRQSKLKGKTPEIKDSSSDELLPFLMDGSNKHRINGGIAIAVKERAFESGCIQLLFKSACQIG